MIISCYLISHILAVYGNTLYCNSQNGQTFNEDEYWKVEGEIENQIFLHTMHEEENMEEDHSLKEMVDIHFEKYLNKLRSEKELKDEKVEINYFN